MGLFSQELQVLNVGLGSFAESIVRAGGKAAQIEWAPPAQGDRVVGRALAQLVNHPTSKLRTARPMQVILLHSPCSRASESHAE